MRTTLASLLSASILSFAAAAHAQAPGATLVASSVDDAGPQDTLTTNPMWDLLGGFNLAYERAFSRHVAVMVAAMHLSASGTGDLEQSESVSINELTIQPHFYFGHRALQGFYIAPFVQVLAASASSSGGGAATGAGLAVGATFGWSWLAGPANIKLGIGPELVASGSSGVDDDGVPVTAAAGGLGLAMDLTMGWAF